MCENIQFGWAQTSHRHVAHLDTDHACSYRENLSHLFIECHRLFALLRDLFQLLEQYFSYDLLVSGLNYSVMSKQTHVLINLILGMVRCVADLCFWSFLSPLTLTGWGRWPPTLSVVLLKISSIKGRFFSPLPPRACLRSGSWFLVAKSSKEENYNKNITSV